MTINFGTFLLMQSPSARSSQEIYARGVEIAQAAEALGFGNVWLAEHHFSTYGYLSRPAQLATYIAAKTTRIRVGTAVIVVPLHHPLVIAEEIATLDLLSGGRLDVGLGRGYQPYEFERFGLELESGRARWEESIDILLKTFEGRPFSYDGKLFKIPETTVFPQPLQKPHPPIWIPGTASPETAIWAGRRGYTFVPFLVPFDIARELFDYYRQGAAEVGREVTPDKLGFLICAVTADTKTKALEAGRHFVWRMGATLRGPVEFFSPVGMRSRAGSQFALKARPRSLGSMSYEELVAGHFIIAGTPDEVADRFALVQRELGIGHLLLEAQESKMDHPTTMRSIELMGAKVIPAVASL